MNTAPQLPAGDLRLLVICRYDYGSPTYQRWIVLRLQDQKLGLFAFADDSLTQPVEGVVGTFVELFSRNVFWPKDCTVPKEVKHAVARFFKGLGLNQGIMLTPDFATEYDRANALRKS